MTAEYDVLVVGAGAAGIGAAQRLRAAGKRVLILEARNRIVGRTHTIDFHGHPYDLGAQFLHSASVNPMVQRAEALGRGVLRSSLDWDTSQFPAGMGPEERAVLLGELEAFFAILETPCHGDPSLASVMNAMPSQRYRPLLEALWTWISSREAEESSINDVARYHDTAEDWQVRGGYGALVESLAQGIDIQLSTPVKVIRKTPQGVEAVSDRGTVRAAKIIVTLPSNLLIAEAIRFEPGLPLAIEEVLAAVPMGWAGKLLFRIAKPHPALYDGARLRVSVSDRWTPSYHVSYFGAPILMGFFGGKRARDLEAAGTQAWADHALEGLKSLLGSDIVDHLADPMITGWNGDPFSMGAYSAASPGQAHLRDRLAEPFDDQLFLAGEHCSLNYYSTVHGAWMTGERAADWALAY